MVLGIVNRILSLFQGLNWLIIPAALLAIVFHEVCHGYVAYLMGDRTAKEGGRLSLNPLKHMDPIGIICMIVFGFGWAKPVPVNPYYFKYKRLGMSLVAFAGPLSNLLLATLAMILAEILMNIDVTSTIILTAIFVLIQFLLYLAILNVGLAAFNLIPIPPLDGSKVLFAVLPRKAYGHLLKYERYGMLVLIVLINIPFFSDFLMCIRSGIFDCIMGFISSILY